MNTKERLQLFNPLYWPVWLAIGLLWLITCLPIRTQLCLGRGIGRLVYRCSPELRRITQVNLTLCFPRLTDVERTALMKNNFASLGMGLIETGMAWWLSDRRLKQCHITLNGLSYVDEALRQGKGIILVSPHFMCLEMLGRLLGQRYAFAVMYRPHKNPVLAYVQYYFRRKYRCKQIARQDIRGLLKTLQENTAVWFAYDIDAGKKRSVFAPFFGIQTASLTSASRIAEMSGATVIPIDFYREEKTWGYVLNLYPPLSPFPGKDYIDDATRLNARIEQSVQAHPEQYIWQYKRFKTRPTGEKRFY